MGHLEYKSNVFLGTIRVFRDTREFENVEKGTAREVNLTGGRVGVTKGSGKWRGKRVYEFKVIKIPEYRYSVGTF